MHLLWCFLIGYGLGIINPAFIIGKIKGFDVRRRGSGNAGGSNALITMGKAIGFLCILLDIGKAFLAVKLTGLLFPGLPLVFPVTAAACILGHMFPFYMGFSGGKGLACIGGCLLAYSPLWFLILLAAEAALALAVNYICVVPISASVLLPVLYGFHAHDPLGAVILGVVGVAIILKHVENIRRILNGTELHLSYLWNKDKETKRQEAAIALEEEKQS